ncbi:PIG-L family deacetylase [Marinomonas pollencensis]|uniref:GlcNAc-PI de-N-acetylase n=1 Tax=Marinomonas pollencensis TaxID=491954 RepID=A0A3E0DF18_9GAMM|nr:PIG-L family deacetylase [Marinomonas pollencensis]REG81300.1 GlcNAc-PI de-N-acetylase [Marinomonas pollencensis]
MNKRDYQYALQPDWQSSVTLSKHISSSKSDQKLLHLTDLIGFSALDLKDYTWLLAFSYQSTSKKKQGRISAALSEDHLDSIGQVQYFEADEVGERYFNLSGLIEASQGAPSLLLSGEYCQLPLEAKLLGFKKPDLADGPILIIAPHADDAELAAYGLYEKYSEQIWITTINAGQNVQKLDRQYIPNLDDSMDDAVLRKAHIRAWNSMSTPLLAGVKLENLSSLGYFGLTKDSLYKTPNQEQEDHYLPTLSPAISRTWNTLSLPSDDKNVSSGQSLIDDLVYLLERIKPSTVLVTEPEIDPHVEHVMSAHALALAIKQGAHVPERVLMYVNHLRKIKKFPYGPEHTRTALPPWFNGSSVFGQFSCYSHQLTLEEQKAKVVSFDSMHDLRSKSRIGKNLKKWWNKKVLKNGFQYYGDHSYFQTHIKANEVFTLVDGRVFSDSLTQANGK